MHEYDPITLNDLGYDAGIDAARDAVKAIEDLLAGLPAEETASAMTYYGDAFAAGFARSFGRRMAELVKERRCIAALLDA